MYSFRPPPRALQPARHGPHAHIIVVSCAKQAGTQQTRHRKHLGGSRKEAEWPKRQEEPYVQSSRDGRRALQVNVAMTVDWFVALTLRTKPCVFRAGHGVGVVLVLVLDRGDSCIQPPQLRYILVSHGVQVD